MIDGEAPLLKLITFTVPCYNSQAYMDKCIQSLLPAGDEAEIILVDDGSTDETGAIADRYAAEYPDIVRVIHQENGGHGEGVNQGIRNAKGLYFEVVDSDDWLDGEALKKLMALLRTFPAMETPVDLIICNYVYEHTLDHTQKFMRYRKVLPIGEPFGWDRLGHLNAGQFITIHSAVYRTQALRDSGVTLPKHTFYVDNIYVYEPLPTVKTLYYLDEDLYRYFIGRADQSVTTENMIKRIDQHILVVKHLVSCHDLEALMPKNRRLAKYMYHYLSIMMMITTIFLWLSGTPEHMRKADDLWAWLKAEHPDVHRRLRYHSFNVLFFVLPGRAGRWLCVHIFYVLQYFFKFN